MRGHDAELIKVVAEDIHDAFKNDMVQSFTVAKTMANDNFFKRTLQNESSVSEAEEVAALSDFLNNVNENFGYKITFVVSTSTLNYYYNGGLNKKIDVVNNPYDIWYKNFIDKNVPVEVDIDFDEFDRKTWNAFVNARVEDDKGNLIGVCGVGVEMKKIQELLAEKETTHNVKIDVFHTEENFNIDTGAVKFKDPHLKSILTKLLEQNKEDKELMVGKFDDAFVIARHIPELSSYLVVRREESANDGILSRLIFQMSLSFALILGLLMFFVHVRLLEERKRIAETSQRLGIASYADFYTSMHMIDLKDNSIHMLSQNDNYDMMKIQDGDNAMIKLKDSIIASVDESTIKPLLEFINLKDLRKRMEGKRIISQEFLSKNYGWCKANFIFVDTADDEFNQVIFAIELIHEEKEREKIAEDFKIRSETDLMTGLKNRGGGEKAIRDLMAEGVEGMFCLMDADKFKTINDTYGHGVGDKVIIAIANCLKKTFRTNDITMRLGGDEFAVYAVGIIDEQIGENVINRLFRSIDDVIIPELGDRKITISLGSAIFRADENISFDDLYKRADLGTYESKKVQGNCHTSYKK